MTDEQMDLGLPVDVVEGPAFVPQGYRTGLCRTCKERVIWAAMVDANGRPKRKPDGKPVFCPVNLRARTDGQLRFVEHGRAQMIPHGVYVEPHERRISHFATCPKADEHRQPKQGRPDLRVVS